MNRNRWRAVCFSLSLLLLIAAVAQIMFPELNNWKLQIKGKSSVYLRCEDLEADKLADELYNTEGYFGGSTTLVLKKNVVLYPKKDVYYYASPSDLEPAYILRAGEIYEAESISAGYGFVTWPTYSREWRYGKPFVAAKGLGFVPEPYEEIAEMPFYYVRYEDLLELAKGQTGQGIRRMYHHDNWLCDLGLYYSPNLPYPVFDWWNIGFLTAGVLLLAGVMFWPCYGRKKNARLASSETVGPEGEKKEEREKQEEMDG